MADSEPDARKFKGMDLYLDFANNLNTEQLTPETLREAIKALHELTWTLPRLVVVVSPGTWDMALARGWVQDGQFTPEGLVELYQSGLIVALSYE